MVRTQIYLPEQLYRKLLALRSVRKKSIAQIIRDALEKHLQEDQSGKENDILQLAELDLRGGPKDLSASLEEYLYGKNETPS